MWTNALTDSSHDADNAGLTSADADEQAIGARRTRFTVLGMLTLADGRDCVVLQPSRPAALLAALLLRANSVVSADFLQRVIWGDGTPAQAKSALHSCVLRLRRLFGKYGVAGNAIEAVPGGYRLTADAQTLDLVEFRELLDRAYSAPDTAPEKELALLRAALALWQPPLLANVPSELLHRDEVPRLHEEWRRAIHRVFDLELARGRHREALAEIWPAARAHPLDERFTEQLMEALHRTGRRAEALAEYRRFKALLAEQLGVDPGPALQRLELAILRGDADPGPGADPPRPPARGTSRGSPGRTRPPAPAGEDLAPPHAGPAYATAGAGPGPVSAQDPGESGPGPGPGSHPGPGPGPRPGPESRRADAGGTSGTGGPVDPAADAALLPGEGVLDRLVGAGLLEEGPRGHYRMHELLRVFTRAAAAEGVGARTAASPARTPTPTQRPGAVELHPTEA